MSWRRCDCGGPRAEVVEEGVDERRRDWPVIPTIVRRTQMLQRSAKVYMTRGGAWPRF